MNRKYYTIAEVVKILKEQEKPSELEYLCNYTREKLIRPIVYINSLPVYACVSDNNGQAVAVGACYLSAYLDLKDEIIALLDLLQRSATVRLGYHIKKIHMIEEPLLTGWSYQSNAFEGVPSNLLRPQPYSDELLLEYFYFPRTQPGYLSINNVLITQNDLNFMVSQPLIKLESITDLVKEIIKEENTDDNDDKHNDSTSNDTVEKSEEEIKEIWDQVGSKLDLMTRDLQMGNKIEYARRGINLVLEAIQKIIPTFKRMEMPNNVESFHKFCLALPCGDKIFPTQKTTFNRYCRGTITKKRLPSLCGWFNPPKLKENFWSSLYPSVSKSYRVVQVTR